MTEWDEDVNVLIEEEPQDTETMPIEEDGQPEILGDEPEQENTLAGIDFDDLFEDEEEEVNNDG